MTSGFNPKDAQAKIVLGEAAHLQKVIWTKCGNAYIEWLRDRELAGMGLQGQLAEEYVNALARNDLKGFRQFFLVRLLS